MFFNCSKVHIMKRNDFVLRTEMFAIRTKEQKEYKKVVSAQFSLPL